MEWWQAALLGLIQGLTEFLPVSSSGHLVLGQYLLGLDTSENITFEVFVHFGTVLSIITVYRRRVVALIQAGVAGLLQPAKLGGRYREDDAFRTVLLILITMVPTGIIYVLFGERIQSAFEMPRFTSAMLLVTGVLLLLTLLRRNPDGPITPLKAFVIGVAQSVAMLPGISRSGSTICAALYQNVDNEEAADFSFLMLLPVVIGATLLKSFEIAEQGGIGEVGPLLIGTLVAYVTGMVAIKVMIGLVARGNIHYFAFYLFIVGTLGLVLI